MEISVPSAHSPKLDSTSTTFNLTGVDDGILQQGADTARLANFGCGSAATCRSSFCTVLQFFSPQQDFQRLQSGENASQRCPTGRDQFAFISDLSPLGRWGFAVSNFINPRAALPMVACPGLVYCRPFGPEPQSFSISHLEFVSQSSDDLTPPTFSMQTPPARSFCNASNFEITRRCSALGKASRSFMARGFNST